MLATLFYSRGMLSCGLETFRHITWHGSFFFFKTNAWSNKRLYDPYIELPVSSNIHNWLEYKRRQSACLRCFLERVQGNVLYERTRSGKEFPRWYSELAGNWPNPGLKKVHGEIYTHQTSQHWLVHHDYRHCLICSTSAAWLNQSGPEGFSF